MTLERIHLRKLLQLLYCSEKIRRRLLLSDIREDERRESQDEGGGGHFQLPFWTDVRRHIAGEIDLQAQTQIRVRSNRRRERLYPLLTNSFLRWLNENRRTRNEPFEIIPERVKGRVELQELGLTIKVENILAVRIVGRGSRFIYPYFSEEPALTEQAVRAGLHVMCKALQNCDPNEIRILDVLRGESFSLATNPLNGTERDDLANQCRQLLSDRQALLDARDA